MKPPTREQLRDCRIRTEDARIRDIERQLGELSEWIEAAKGRRVMRCHVCDATLDHGLQPSWIGQLIALCHCCGRTIAGDCGGAPAFSGPLNGDGHFFPVDPPRAMMGAGVPPDDWPNGPNQRWRRWFCDDCWVHALSLLAIPTLRAQVIQ